eukprot:4273613-Pyramimonas_sp.AAC.1
MVRGNCACPWRKSSQSGRRLLNRSLMLTGARCTSDLLLSSPSPTPSQPAPGHLKPCVRGMFIAFAVKCRPRQH